MTKYEELEVRPGTYVPQMGIDYPEDDPYTQLYQPVYDRDFPEVDEHYPYVDDSLKFRILEQGLMLHTILGVGLRLMLRVRMGWRVEGREWLQQYKEQLRGGAITVTNHCFRHDCPATILATGHWHNIRIPMFAPNFRTKDGFFMHAVGGIPLPDASQGMAATKAFNAAFDEFHRRGLWFHIFPEAKRWDFYKPLRPFQKGAFTMAYRYGMPIVPCVITFRERTGIFRLFGPKNLPLITTVIGEPIIPDTSAPRGQEVNRLRDEAHARMEQMAGITHNPWPSGL